MPENLRPRATWRLWPLSSPCLCPECCCDDRFDRDELGLDPEEDEESSEDEEEEEE